MSRYYIGPQATCELTQARTNKLMGYPREGVDIGRGRHIKHDLTTGAGWTMRAHDVAPELDKDDKPTGKWQVGLHNPDTDGDTKKLSAAELADLRAKWSAGTTPTAEAIIR